MAQSSLRLRRALASLAALHRPLSSSAPTISAPPLLKTFSSSISSQHQPSLASISQSRAFRSSPMVSLSAGREYKLYKEGDEITEDTVLFEGCDYNHWLITMEFTGDPKPGPEEMVRAYEETCAKGLNISLEEAKKRMYACSTTTYQGFQAVMTEAESEKFAGLPGVVFILPDSYIDPVNKEYGGDKYENGVITPRPPPFTRNTAGRFRDQNRNSGGPPRNDRQAGPMSNQRGVPTQEGRNYGAPQNYPPQQNFGPPGQGGRNPRPMNNMDNATGRRDSYQAEKRDPMPYQGNYNQGEQGYGFPAQGNQRGYGQSNFARNDMNYAPPSPGGTYGQGTGSNYGQSYSGQGAGSNYGQGYTGQGTGNMQEDRRNREPVVQTGTDQGRY